MQRDGHVAVFMLSTSGVVTVRRWSEQGAIDAGFGGVALPIAYPRTAISDQGDGAVLAGDDRAIRLTDTGGVAAEYPVPPGLNPTRVTAASSFDGGLVIAGEQQPDMFVAKFHGDGTLDNAFGGNGRLVVNGLASIGGAVADDDGHLFVAGTTDTTGGTWSVVRIDPTGQRDETFGRAGAVTFDIGGVGDGAVRGIALQSDGRIVVAGGRGESVVVARLEP